MIYHLFFILVDDESLFVFWGKMNERLIHGFRNHLHVRLTWMASTCSLHNRKLLWLLSQRLQWIFYFYFSILYHVAQGQIASLRHSKHTWM